VPPPWAFGLWKSRDVHHNQDSVLVDVERLRQYGIPSSVLVLDSPWVTGYNNFIVNRTQFPAPEKMFARIRELGFELCLWLTPFVNDSNVIDMRGITPASSNFDEARRHLVKDSTGAVALSRFAAFSPFMQVHMTSNLGPWDFDDETLDIFRRFAVLRTRLFPYLYDAVHESAKSGMPVIRPMVLAFQDDREAWQHIYQYMYGPDLLVAPVVQPGTRRSVYLPRGRWIDYWSRVAVDGPRVIEVDAPLAHMPLYVRAGAILPLLPDDVQTLVRRHADMAADVVAIGDARVLEVWPGGSGRVTTHDGVRAVLDVVNGASTLLVGSAAARAIEVRLLGIQLPTLRVDGGAVRVDAQRNRTVITFAALTGEQTVRWTERQP
jgi:alpha-glucosidase (family GH31 glycosyl hydrolase)